MTKLVTPFLQALKKGKICLHPTDTSPGLTFDPKSKEAHIALSQLKKRSHTKPYLGLVASTEQAKHYWQPLPRTWDKGLKNIWPSPLTLIWQASDHAPATLVNNDGYLALRYPHLSSISNWLYEVINTLSCPLPSTSVNISQDKPSLSWEEAIAFCQQRNIFIPSLESHPSSSYVQSTLVKIKKNGHYELLRQGDYPIEKLNAQLN